MVRQDAETRHLRRLSLFRKLMFAAIVVVTILSLMSIPLRVSMIRDIWFTDDDQQDDPTSDPWVYSVTAGWEILNLLLMTYAFFAVLNKSAIRSLITSLVCVMVAIACLICLICSGSYGFIAASTVVYVILGFLFAFFGQYVMYEEIPIDFYVRSRDGKTSPLLT